MSGIRVTYTGLISLSVGITAIITSSIFTVLITRKLLPEEYGVWGVISGVIVYVVFIGAITSFWTTREISRGRYVGKTQMMGTSLLSIVAVFAYLFISYFVTFLFLDTLTGILQSLNMEYLKYLHEKIQDQSSFFCTF